MLMIAELNQRADKFACEGYNLGVADAYLVRIETPPHVNPTEVLESWATHLTTGDAIVWQHYDDPEVLDAVNDPESQAFRAMHKLGWFNTMVSRVQGQLMTMEYAEEVEASLV